MYMAELSYSYEYQNAIKTRGQEMSTDLDPETPEQCLNYILYE